MFLFKLQNQETKRQVHQNNIYILIDEYTFEDTMIFDQIRFVSIIGFSPELFIKQFSTTTKETVKIMILSNMNRIIKFYYQQKYKIFQLSFTCKRNSYNICDTLILQQIQRWDSHWKFTRTIWLKGRTPSRYPKISRSIMKTQKEIFTFKNISPLPMRQIRL